MTFPHPFLSQYVAPAGGGWSGAFGYISGGFESATTTDIIEKLTFATDGDTSDVGDLTLDRDEVSGSSSSDSGYTAGGRDSFFRDRIDKFPFASDANATSGASH